MLLRDQGLPRQHLNTVFHALVMSRLQYALPVWSDYLSIELIGQINSLLKRAYKYGFSSTLHTVENMANVACWVVFGECPLGAGSLLAHSSHLLLFIFIVHTQSKDVFVIFVVICVRLCSYCTSFGTVFCLRVRLICALNYYLLTYLP